MQYWSWAINTEITNGFSNPAYPAKSVSSSEDNKVDVADDNATISLSRNFMIEEPNYHFLSNSIKGSRGINVGENEDVEFKFNLSFLTGAISDFTFGFASVLFIMSESKVEVISSDPEITPSYISFSDGGSVMDESSYGCSFTTFDAATGTETSVDLGGNPGEITIKRENGVWTFNNTVFNSPITAVKYLLIFAFNWHSETDHDLGARVVGTYNQIAMPESTSVPPIPLSQVGKPTWTKKVLTWNDVPSAERYEIKLYNASGEALDTQTVLKDIQRYDYTDLIENDLPAGSYTATVQALPGV